MFTIKDTAVVLDSSQGFTPLMPVLNVALDDNSLKFDSEPSFILAKLIFAPPPRNSLKWRGSKSKPILKMGHFNFVLHKPYSTSSLIVTKQVGVVVTLVFGTSPVESRLRHRVSSLRILVCFESPQTNSGTVSRLRHHRACRRPNL